MLVVGMVCTFCLEQEALVSRTPRQGDATVWQLLVSAVGAAFGCSVAWYESRSRGLTEAWMQPLLVGQAGVMAGAATYLGFEGSQVLLGGGVGLACAWSSGFWAVDLEPSFPGASFVFYCVGAALGAAGLTLCRPLLLGSVGPLLGGLLIVSSCFVLLQLAQGVPASEPLRWCDALELILGSSWGGFAVLCKVGGAILAVPVFTVLHSARVAAICSGVGIVLGSLSSVSYSDWKAPLIGGLSWALITAGGSLLSYSNLATAHGYTKVKSRDSRDSRNDKSRKSGRDKKAKRQAGTEAGAPARGLSGELSAEPATTGALAHDVD